VFRTFSSGEIDAAFNKLLSVPAGQSTLPGVFFSSKACGCHSACETFAPRRAVQHVTRKHGAQIKDAPTLESRLSGCRSTTLSIGLAYFERRGIEVTAWRNLRVRVMGAGTGGLCLAHRLRAAGINAMVFERDRVPPDAKPLCRCSTAQPSFWGRGVALCSAARSNTRRITRAATTSKST
jgi:hypothetical protein